MTMLWNWLFGTSGLTPHGFCLLWEPGLIWTYAISDIGIALAYFSIPAALIVFARRRTDFAYGHLLWLFAAFILLCGTTHWLDVLTLWLPAYGLLASVKAMTAVASLLTAVILWRLIPQALLIPSPAQLRQANEALGDSEALHRASFEQSPVPLQRLDGEGVLTGVSRSWLALLGYAQHDVVGRPMAAFLAGDAPRWTGTEWPTLIGRGEIRDVELQFRHADGSLVDVQLSARLERRGNATVIVAVLIDISARRRAEAALRATEDRLRQAQKMEAVGQLTGGIAHDFNNMLQAIGGGLELMDRRVAEGRTADLTRYVAVARQAVDRAASLTHRLLAFSRRQALQPTAFEPGSLVRGMEELIGRTVGPNILLKLSLAEGCWPVLCDFHQLESALLNLAINARDAMPDGGTLSITTGMNRLGPADVAGEDGADPGDYVAFTVTDTGTGMSPDTLARAFDPFFTTKPPGQGTGLGLSQLYGFVRQSKGVVRLSSELGGGTTASLFLPRAVGGVSRRSAAPPSASPAESMAAPRGSTVLVVDDETMVRTQIAESLLDLGYVVLQAADGLEALRIMRSDPGVDVLVTDVGLPGLNGRELADNARVVRPHLPVLLITGFAGTALETLRLTAGMEVIRKPFAMEDLAARLRVVLRAGELEARTG